ncbi:hypothetical protein RchiOBHm_Chr1g0315721 [Rosa chinensis]|uniref:Uncharacterized protein n=1 Tax=Rosa chinensis TaxID=74649 RepID=A0A2P6S7F9_ROSCH|nr:hypothetical protein RchiOBHm_Chr1g0315721 [Rosa chinensis]
MILAQGQRSSRSNEIEKNWISLKVDRADPMRSVNIVCLCFIAFIVLNVYY